MSTVQRQRIICVERESTVQSQRLVFVERERPELPEMLDIPDLERYGEAEERIALQLAIDESIYQEPI